MSAAEQKKEHPTSLTDDQYNRCLKEVVTFLEKNSKILNRELREISGIGYDQAIRFFKRATEDNRLVRKGTSSSTHYVLPSL
jgi:hypothetical protein